MSSIIISIIVCFLIHSVMSASSNQTETIDRLNIRIDYGKNNSIMLFYDITTNYSYFITFRLFGEEQLKFGLFPSTNHSGENSIKIPRQYSTKESFYLFIVCFHFILDINDLGIQCKDIRLLKREASYKPMFVPLMYALSVIMLLPVIIQHHRHKKALTLQRRKTIRRLSLQIVQDDQHPQQNLAKSMLSHIDNNGDTDYANIPPGIELMKIPSKNEILDDITDKHVTFTLSTLKVPNSTYNHSDQNEPADVTADDCIAHLLDNTPWNTSHINPPLTTSFSRNKILDDRVTTINELHVSTIIPFFDDDDDDDDDQKPILKNNVYPKITLHNTNPAFLETDV